MPFFFENSDLIKQDLSQENSICRPILEAILLEVKHGVLAGHIKPHPLITDLVNDFALELEQYKDALNKPSATVPKPLSDKEQSKLAKAVEALMEIHQTTSVQLALPPERQAIWKERTGLDPLKQYSPSQISSTGEKLPLAEDRETEVAKHTQHTARRSGRNKTAINAYITAADTRGHKEATTKHPQPEISGVKFEKSGEIVEASTIQKIIQQGPSEKPVKKTLDDGKKDHKEHAQKHNSDRHKGM